MIKYKKGNIMTKKITIHKKNEIVRGGDKYSIYAKRLMNTIYFALQKHNLYKYNKIAITFANIREMLNLESEQNYVEIMKKSFLELKQPIELNNFKHPDGTLYNWYVCSFLNDVGFYKKNNQWYADIEVNRLIKQLMQQKGNFTKLDLTHYLNKLRTKYAMKLYEYLKSFGAFRYLDITQEHLLKLLGLEESATYKHYSNLKQLLERQLKEIAKKTDLNQVKLIDNKLLSKEKKYRIIIDPNSKRDVSQTEAKTALNNLLKQIRF